MMTKSRNIFILIVVLCIVGLFSSAGTWAAEQIDVQKPSKVIISYVDEGTPLMSADFRVYKLGSLDADETLHLTALGKKYPVDFSQQTVWRESAVAMEGYLLRDQVKPDLQGKTDGDGHLTFSNLATGLYLIVGMLHEQNQVVYSCEPFLLQTPYFDNEKGVWIYDFEVEPKKEREPLADSDEEKQISRKVLKVWKDGKDANRPAAVFVDLLKDGKDVDTVELNEANGWKYTWADLAKGHQWVVVEREVEGYQVQVSREGNAYVITNTKEGTTPDEEQTSVSEGETLPWTGQPWILAAGLFALGLLLVVLGLLCRRGENHEG